MNEKQKTFTTNDDTELFYRYRSPRAQKTESILNNTDESVSLDNTSASQKAIVLFHRGHEHSARIMHITDELKLDDAHYFAWDARGHGNSPGERGDSPSITTSVADIDSFIHHICDEYNIDIKNIVVIAQSVSAVLVSTWLHDYAPKICCAVLATPAFSVKLYVPFARQGLKVMQKIRGNFFVNSYVKAHYLTHDKERIESYNNDTLIAKAISVRILLGLYDAGDRIVADAAAITTPIQLLIAGDDKIVHHKPQHDFYNRLGSHVKERHVMQGFYHDVLGEQERHLCIEKMRTFINTQFEKPYPHVDVTQSHHHSFTRQEADEISTPLSPRSPRGLYWAMVRAGLRIGGKWSKGLKIGANTGYDSGSTLDYVYQNKPQGSNSIGKAIDKTYLNAIGWRGIRQRKINIGIAINTAMKKLRDDNKPVHVLDIASGHGRYILDALTSENKPDSIRLRDYSPINVSAGRTLIEERELNDIAHFDEVDAFNRDNYQNLTPTPTLGIVSGLHELFPNNDLIMNSLHGFADAIESGNYLIYTGQPWHPQLEMIGRCLTSHQEGQDWVMRRRTQQEMDQLVEKAGFVKIKQWIDDDGIFTVSLAKRT
ncbi:MAG: bifunctional alpha/beta hydrolase/class I SAM-dependent methyltransferase [Gammaproteobacteria bacterium]|nr:bifunctional alpha/beta hydrolase/class I SAM-dependent methyltransferase [Gammaproteobacteria bacterium]